MYKKLCVKKIKYEKCQEGFKAANGQAFNMIAIAAMKIRIGKLNVVHNVYIAHEMVHTFILGSDFLKKHKCDILFSKGQLSIDGSNVCLHKRYNNFVCSISGTQQDMMIKNNQSNTQVNFSPNQQISAFKTTQEADTHEPIWTMSTQFKESGESEQVNAKREVARLLSTCSNIFADDDAYLGRSILAYYGISKNESSNSGNAYQTISSSIVVSRTCVLSGYLCYL